MASRFFDEFLNPTYQALDSASRDFTQGYQDEFVNPIRSRYQSLLDRIESSYAKPTAEPGPRFGVQGPRKPVYTGSPHEMISVPPNPDMAGNPYYPGGEMDLETEDVGAAPEFAAAQEPVHDPASLGTQPPSGQPGKNEYDTMLKDYLTRLRQPVELPQPQPLTKAQMFNIVLNPDRATELREQYQGADYKRRLMEFQVQHGREAQAAEITGKLAERQDEIQRREAERSWFRESALANSGGAVPQGYVWKNPELEAVWKQKGHEKTQADLRTKKYLESVRGTGKTKPANQYEHLQNLFSERARLEGLLLNPGTAQAVMMAQHGVGEPGTVSMIQNIQQELARKKDEETAIRAMDKATYDMFMQADGVRQQRIIQEYLAALKARGGMPGATNQSPSLP